MSDWEGPNGYVRPELGQIDPRELSPLVPIQWRDFPPEQRPYANPEQEYIRSPQPIKAKTLRYRWQGLYNDTDLQRLHETPEWRGKRLAYQDEVMKQSLVKSMAGDVEFQTRRLGREIIDLCSLIENVQYDIDQEFEYRPAKGKEAGLGYVKQPISIDSKVKLVNARIALSDCIARRLGLANEVLKVTVEKEVSLEVRLTQLMERSDPEFAAVQRVLKDKLGNLVAGALPAGDGEAKAANLKAEWEAERVIDATPLPRLGANGA